jgi:hypothetical protein
MKRPQTLGLLTAALFCLAANPVHAAFTLYGDQASYEAASFNNTFINFEGIAPDNDSVNFPTPPGLDISGVNFTINTAESNGFLYVLGKGFEYTNTSVLTSQFSTATNDNILITLPAGQTALAFTAGNLLATSMSATLSDGSVIPIPQLGFPFLKFIGLTSDVPITSLQISQAATGGPDAPSPPGDQINMDRFIFGTAGAVPEPSSFVLMGVAGVAFCGWRAMSRRRRATA